MHLISVQTENSSSEVGDYSTFIRQEFGDRSYARNAGIIYGLIFGIVWPYVLWILLQLIGYILIVLTFGHARGKYFPQKNCIFTAELSSACIHT